MTTNTNTPAPTYTELDQKLICLFENRDLLAILKNIGGKHPILFNPKEEEVWTSPVGGFLKGSYAPYEGQTQQFYRALTVTQLGWGSNTFKVCLNLRAPGATASSWVVDTQETRWIFSYECGKEQLLEFLDSI